MEVALELCHAMLSYIRPWQKRGRMTETMYSRGGLRRAPALRPAPQSPATADRSGRARTWRNPDEDQQDGEPVRREAGRVVALPVVRERAWRPTARIPQVRCRSAELSVLLALPSA
jgi:hypothetical protein